MQAFFLYGCGYPCELHAEWVGSNIGLSHSETRFITVRNYHQEMGAAGRNNHTDDFDGLV